MINLNNLIDYLPFYFKENDTYVVNGKGLLERFLDICGDYFNNSMIKDAESILDITHIENTDASNLKYLWEFLGEIPFAQINKVDSKRWQETIGLSDSSRLKLSKVPNSKSLSLSERQVRDLLKYSISLFKIRGTSKFFEVIFRIYGLECTVDDPAKRNDYDGWLTRDPAYDQEDQYDKSTHDSMPSCIQCTEVEFTISGHRYTSQTEEFTSFRKSMESFFDRFTPYNVKPKLNYGFEVDDNILIGVSLLNPKVDTLIQGEVLEVPVVVDVTSDYDNTNLNYQVGVKDTKGDIQWSFKTYPTKSLYYVKLAGTYYFRSVEDESVITSITINEIKVIKSYHIECSPSFFNITPSNPIASTTVTAKVIIMRGTLKTEKACSIRISGSTEIYESGHKFEFTTPGQYYFEIVEFPIKRALFQVEAEEAIYQVTCNPTEYTAKGGDLSEAKTKITITSTYGETNLECNLLNTNQVYKNGDTFKANQLGTFKFRCTKDTSGLDSRMGTFTVNNVGTVIEDLEVTSPAEVRLNEMGQASIRVRITAIGIYQDPGFIPKDLLVTDPEGNQSTITATDRVVDGSTNFVAFETTYYVTKEGKYKFAAVGNTLRSSTTKVLPKTASYEPKIYFEPFDPTDGNWASPDWSAEEIDNTKATYQLEDDNSTCKVYIKGTQDGALIEGQTGTYYLNNQLQGNYLVGNLMELKKPGTYEFRYQDYTATLTLEDFQLVVNISCAPTSGSVGGDIESIPVIVNCTSNKSSFDNRVKQGPDGVPYDSGHTFYIRTPGTYTFYCVGDISYYTTFTATVNGSVSPTTLTWEADDVSNKQIQIDVDANSSWSIEIE